MDFPNESLPIIAGTISNCGKSMFSAMKYIYAISDDDFYNINVKDIFKVALQDVTNSDTLVSLGIKLDGRKNNELSNPDFARTLPLLNYYFAVRLPFLRRVADCPLKDKQIKAVYEIITSNDGDNYAGVITETFDENMKLAKGKLAVPAFNSEWFRRYVYTYLPEIGAINNRNLYFLGCVEAMFPLFNSALDAQLKKIMFLLQK